VLSYLPAVAGASRAPEFPDAGVPAGMVVVRAAGLPIRGGGTIVAAGTEASRRSRSVSVARLVAWLGSSAARTSGPLNPGPKAPEMRS